MRWLLILLLLSLKLATQAQGFLDLAKVEYLQGLQTANYDEFQSLRLTAQTPILLKNEGVIPMGFALGGYHLALDETSFSPRSIRFNIGYRGKLDDEKSWTLMTIHRMNGDAFAIDSDLYQFGLIGLFTYRDKPGPMLQFGFYTNTEFSGQFFTPLFGLDWNITPRIRLFGVLPINGTLQITANDRLLYGFNFLGVFATYKLGNRDLYLQENFIQPSLYADLYLSRQVVINTKVGYRIGSNNRLFAEGDKVDIALNLVRIGDDRLELENITTNGLMISAGLAFRYAIPEND